MNRITPGQLCAMGLIGEIFAVFCTEGSISAATAAGYAMSSGVLLLLAMPLALHYRRGGRLCRGAALVLFVWLIFWGGRLFCMQQRTTEVIYIPFENSGGLAGKLLVTGLIGLVCLYISSSGVKALGRSAVIAAAAGTLGLTAVAFSAASSHEWGRLSLEWSDMGGELVRGLKAGGGIGAFAVMLGLQRESYIRSTAVYFSAKSAVSAAVLLTSVLVAGGIMQTAEFPVVTAAHLSQPFPSQRIDSLFLILFTVYAVFAIAVQAAAASYLLRQMIPGFRRFGSLTVIVLMLGTCLITM
ncbi:MAG: hypothetical protein IKO47_00815 [Ruminococcus sp.]|nr:hypothetical protein [Ruminococcus sp.]